MRLASVQAVVRALDAAGVRYLVAGGLAVNAYGVHRFTKHLDLVVALEPDNVRAAFKALAGLGYRPAVPVTADQFADDRGRRAMAHEKGMQVLQFWSDEHRETPIDVFVEEPFPFDEEYGRGPIRELTDAGSVHIVSLATLIGMKEAAGRAQDRVDVEKLKERHEELE